MPYATREDIERIYGPEALYLLADRDGGGGIDAEAVDQALIDASGTIDGYIGGRYALPLTAVPAILVGICVDLAVYRLGGALGGEERRKRYDDAIRYLERVADGKIQLATGAEAPAKTGDDAAQISSAERTFSRDSMKGF